MIRKLSFGTDAIDLIYGRPYMEILTDNIDALHVYIDVSIVNSVFIVAVK
jgi:hypothetical protein